MPKILSDTTAAKILQVIEDQGNSHGRARQETRRRRRSTGGGGSLVYATSPNTDLDLSFTFGAKFPFPGDIVGNATALTVGSFHLSTPWNTRVTAPTRLFAFWNKIGSDYYLPVTTFYVKFDVAYPSSGGAEQFTAYYNDSATFSIGDETDFPSNIEVKLTGFANGTASTEILGYFEDMTFIASFDSQNNILYITHPRF